MGAIGMKSRQTLVWRRNSGLKVKCEKEKKEHVNHKDAAKVDCETVGEDEPLAHNILSHVLNRERH